MTVSKHAAPANRLLAALPSLSRQKFLASCEPVEVSTANILCEAGERIRYVYFPIDCVIYLITTLGDGARLEVGIIGDEGMLGIPLILGVTDWSQRAVVQGSGAAWRMSAAIFSRQCTNNSALRRRLNRYVYVVLRQRALLAACAKHHVLQARLARLLLMAHDRAHASHFYLTQELLSYLLGVRRVSVTSAAGSLQEHGLVNYRRGEIAILDAVGLEKAACGCYRQASAIYEEMLG